MKSLLKFVRGQLAQILPERLVWSVRYLIYPEKFEVVGGPLTFAKDGLATAHNSDSLREEHFQEAYRLGKETGSWRGSWGEADPEWRAYVACWAARNGSSLEGDFVECGVYKGGMSRAIVHLLNFNNLDKDFYLIDTFEGMVEEQLSEGEKGRLPFESCYEQVVETFKPYPRVKVVKGAVPHVLESIEAEKVCYLSIDMNCAEPEIDAANFFWGKLVRGAVIVLDDYNNMGHEVQKTAWDRFAQEKGVQVLSLPTGQGLIIKV